MSVCNFKSIIMNDAHLQVAGIYFAFDLYNLSAGVDASSMNYQSFTAAPPSRSDPFYEPPSAAPDMFQQPVHSSAAGL